MSQFSPTSKNLQQLTLPLEISSPKDVFQVYPASHLVRLGGKKEQKIIATYSPNSSDCFAQFASDGRLLKTSQDCSQLTLDGSFEIFSGKFPKSGMMRDGKLYHAPKLEVATSEKDSGLSLLPTPVKSDASVSSVITKEMQFYVTKNGTWRKISNSGQDGSVGLTRTLKLPTPKHSDRLTAGVKTCKPQHQQHLSSTVREVLSIVKTDNRLLSPEFVEQIMGFPLGWTDLEVENTDLPPPHLVTLDELPAIIDQGLTEDKPGLRTRLGQLGNAIVPQVGAIAFKMLDKILQEQEKMITLQNLEQEITNLKVDLQKANTQAKKDALSKQIEKLNHSLEIISAYEAINQQDVVINGDPTKLGVVAAKEIQNQLPVIWVDWNGLQTSCVPTALTVIPPKQLDWHWIENDFTRLYDRASCDDIAVLLEELENLKTEEKVLFSRSSQDDLLSEIQKNKSCQDKIIELWQDAISFHYPLHEGFFLHNRKVVVKSYQLCKQHSLVFPVVFDGGHEHLAHPLELRKIPLGQLNIFPEDNTDPLEPEEEPNLDFIIDPEFKNLLRPLTDEEYEQLEKNLIRDGSPIITLWKGHNTIIDGHHSYQIAQKHNIPFSTREIELAERSDVINWMFDLQLGRRNLTEKEKSYYRAKQYNSLKKEKGGNFGNQYTKDGATPRALPKHPLQSILAKAHSEPKANPAPHKDSTAQKIAKKTGVSKSTIKRDVKFAQDTDEIAAKLDVSPQEIIHSDLSKKAVSELKDEPVEVIKKKLANPKAKPKRKLPQLKVGQLVQIKSDRTNKKLVGYNKSYAVVKKLKRNCADIDVWGELLTDIHIQFLYPIEEGKVAICANVSPDFLIRIMENYKDFDSAVEHIPINKYQQGQKLRVLSSYRKNEIVTVTQAIGVTKSNVMFSDGIVETFENRNLGVLNNEN